MTELQGFIWNEGGKPVQFACGGAEDFNAIQHTLMVCLKTNEYGKIVRLMSPSDSITLYYRAFDDQYRGRQVVTGTTEDEVNAAYEERKQQCAAKVFTPAELYDLDPIRVQYDSWHTVNVHLSSEISDPLSIDLDEVAATQRFEVRTLVDHDYDGRRGWTLQTVWFDKRPVMVVNSSGRDGDEYRERWITDGEAFYDLVRFLNSFSKPEGSGEFVKADEKIPAMTEFYNHTIHDYYDVERQESRNK